MASRQVRQGNLIGYNPIPKKDRIARGSQRDRGKPKAIVAISKKLEVKFLAEAHTTWHALFVVGRATKRKPNGSYYRLG